MIQLYKDGNTNYEMNGDYSLDPLKADLSLTLNGEWRIDLEIPQDDAGNWMHLEHDTVIKIRLPKWGDQLYVVSNPQRTDLQTVSAVAYPIAMWDARNELIVRDCRPTTQSGRDALEYILTSCGGAGKYSIDCDISKLNTAYYVRKNFMECLASDDDNSFLNRWGGEILYDNHIFHVLQQAGQDRGMTLSASRNISGFTVAEDDSEFVDVIIPVGYNGWTCPTEVRREKVGRVPHKRFVEYSNIKYVDDASEDDSEDPEITVCQTPAAMQEALEKAAQESFAAGEFQPLFTYSVDFVDLRKCREYEGLDDLLYLWLGDLVRVENLDRHITTQQKVIGLTYDLVADQITEITLGSQARDFFNAASQATSDLKKVLEKSGGTTSVVAEKVAGVINMMNTSLKAQKSAAVRQDVRAILFEDLDKTSPLFGAMALGTQGLQISKERTADGTDWKWGTAITYQSIVADYIITGLLSGKGGNFWFDLDSGRFELGSGLFKGTINTKENANIGKRIYLDYDGSHGDGWYASGIYLGDEAGSDTRPHLSVINMSNDILKQICLYANGSKQPPMIGCNTSQEADGSNKQAECFMRVGTGNGGVKVHQNSIEIRSKDARLVSQEIEHGSQVVVKDEGIWLVGKRLNVSDTNGNMGVGVTYSGTVSRISTVNGIVTRVSE
ncbi:phage tail spike protein [Faecalibaculum rodentium]|uniref:phage tail spike protein n=2 Tax=Faecalibaculum rodentium TaxID=1702221 RepID=UPI002597580B|nr:phage tail spike protein [Faecalibaculum rodentium]